MRAGKSNYAGRKRVEGVSTAITSHGIVKQAMPLNRKYAPSSSLSLSPSLSLEMRQGQKPILLDDFSVLKF